MRRKSAGQAYVDKLSRERWLKLTPAQQAAQADAYQRRKELWRYTIKPGIITVVATLWLVSVWLRM